MYNFVLQLCKYPAKNNSKLPYLGYFLHNSHFFLVVCNTLFYLAVIH